MPVSPWCKVMPHDGKMGHLLKMVALPFPELNMENHGKSKTCGDLSIYRYVQIYHANRVTRRPPQMKLQAFPWVNLSLFREKPHEATILGPFLLEVPRSPKPSLVSPFGCANHTVQHAQGGDSRGPWIERSARATGHTAQQTQF